MGFVVGLALLASGPALAQQSASYRLEEHVLNAGGHPQQFGPEPASASHRLTLGSIGEPFGMRRSLGASMMLDSGFVIAYPPAGEVRDLRFTNRTTLVWEAHPAAGRYNVYRDALASLATLGYGACDQHDLVAPTATETLSPFPGSGFFFLVTVENRLFEEGTKGFQSSGIERTGPVCP